jgi:hypothetical protein
MNLLVLYLDNISPKYELPVVTGYSGDRGGSIHDRMRNEGGAPSDSNNPNGPSSTGMSMQQSSQGGHRMQHSHSDKDKQQHQPQREGRYRPISEVQCYKVSLCKMFIN